MCAYYYNKFNIVWERGFVHLLILSSDLLSNTAERGKKNNDSLSCNMMPRNVENNWKNWRIYKKFLYLSFKIIINSSIRCLWLFLIFNVTLLQENTFTWNLTDVRLEPKFYMYGGLNSVIIIFFTSTMPT